MMSKCIYATYKVHTSSFVNRYLNCVCYIQSTYLFFCETPSELIMLHTKYIPLLLWNAIWIDYATYKVHTSSFVSGKECVSEILAKVCTQIHSVIMHCVPMHIRTYAHHIHIINEAQRLKTTGTHEYRIHIINEAQRSKTTDTYAYRIQIIHEAQRSKTTDT
jgi:hypothetical protein